MASKYPGIVLGALLAALPAVGQVVSLEEAAKRLDSTLAPAREGVRMTVQGTVSSKPIIFGQYAQVPIRDTHGFGLMLEGPDFMFERVTPGDELEVRGIIGQRGGMPVLRPVVLTTLSHTKPPPPLFRRIAQLQSPNAVALATTIEGRVVALGEDPGGDGGEYLLLDDGQPVPYPVYLPRAARSIGTGLSRYRVGDRVRVTGVSSQADSEAPFDSKFRMVVTDGPSVALVDRAWLISPQALLAALLSLVMLGAILMHRRHRHQAARRAVRRIHGFCEELLTAATLEEVYRKLRMNAPRILDVSNLELLRYERGAQILRGTVADPPSDPIPVAYDRESQTPDRAAAMCFRNRTPLHIPDTRYSSLYRGFNRDTIPRGVVLLPMFAREELIGVLEVANQDRPRHFGLEELTALQHMANQIAMVLKMLEQHSRKEQMMRSERLAATGQIVSGVAGELKGPLESILVLAHRLLDNGDPDARAILNESLRASAILSRYSHIVRHDGGEAAPVEINAVLHRVIESCRRDFTQRELKLDSNLYSEPLWIIGSATQMELVLRNLVLLAARAAKSSSERSLKLQSSLHNKRVLVSILYGALLLDENFPEDSSGGLESEALGFGVCRGILQSLGGDVRILHAAENTCRMEIDLPAAFPGEALEPSPKSKAARSLRTLTAIILEPDPGAQRRLVSYWTSRGHRAVPITNEAEALELLHRLRIDVIFCAVRIPGSNWVEFFDRIREEVPAFVLLTDGIESDVSALFPDQDGFVLRKPMEAGEMDRLLDRIEQRVETPVA